MKRIIIIIISLIFSLSACREYIDIDIDEKEKVMVLNGFLNTDSTVRVNLAQSLGVLESNNNFQFISDADVDFYEDGQMKESLQYDSLGYYSGTSRPQAGKSYEIRASAGSFKDIKSRIFIPQPVAVKEINADFTLDSVTEQWWNPQTQQYFDTTIVRMSEEGTIEVKFDDPADEKNYYFLTFNCLMPTYKWEDGYEVRTGEQMISLSYDINTISYENYLYMANFSGYVISDDFFNGQTYALTARIYSWAFTEYAYGSYNALPLSPIYVNLHSVSEEFFDFVISYSKYDETAYNPFAEPVNVLSNVENGYGFFTGYSTYTDSIGFN
jgi:hypothetical protein